MWDCHLWHTYTVTNGIRKHVVLDTRRANEMLLIIEKCWMTELCPIECGYSICAQRCIKLHQQQSKFHTVPQHKHLHLKLMFTSARTYHLLPLISLITQCMLWWQENVRYLSFPLIGYFSCQVWRVNVCVWREFGPTSNSFLVNSVWLASRLYFCCNFFNQKTNWVTALYLGSNS